MICSFCSTEFAEEEARISCTACVLLKGCNLLRCPNCGFEMPPEPKWLTSFLARFSPAAARKNGTRSASCQAAVVNENNQGETLVKAACSLTCLKPNTTAVVAHIEAERAQDMQKLVTLGVLPGVEITLIQKFPSYVFRIWRSQFAVDEELASCIFVVR